MDDVAVSAGISKKTLYRLFENKESLIKKIVKDFIGTQKDEIKSIENESINAIEELLRIYEKTCNNLRIFNQSLINDMRKFYPASWEVFQQFKNDYIYRHVLSNLEKGIHEGLYRNDFDKKIIARFYTARIDLIINPELFSPKEYSYNTILRELFFYHIRGIGSNQGIQYLEQQTKITF